MPRRISGRTWALLTRWMKRSSMSGPYNILNIGNVIFNKENMEKDKKSAVKKPEAKKRIAKKAKKITLLDAAIMGAGMPTMGGL